MSIEPSSPRKGNVHGRVERTCRISVSGDRPRPAGTEEEQRAALYISEQFSAEAGLTTAMEDFQCNPDSSLPRTLCSGVAVLVTLVATIVGALAVPAIVVSLICAALAAAEVFDKPVLSRLLNRGVSQNVVARYLPAKSPTRAKSETTR